mgnify:CR=1 FL=1
MHYMKEIESLSNHSDSIPKFPGNSWIEWPLVLEFILSIWDPSGFSGPHTFHSRVPRELQNRMEAGWGSFYCQVPRERWNKMSKKSLNFFLARPASQPASQQPASQPAPSQPASQPARCMVFDQNVGSHPDSRLNVQQLVCDPCEADTPMDLYCLDCNPHGN